MLSNRALALAVGFMVLPQIGDAAEGAARCVDASAAKRTSDAHHGKWIELTSDQWQFLRGIYAINPLTPRGLPYGDKAALIKIDGRSGGMVFFIDGDKACTPIRFPTSFSRSWTTWRPPRSATKEARSDRYATRLKEDEMTATQLRYRRYLKQTRSTLAIAAFFREYPQFNDCEFTFTGRSVTIFANEPNADLADICEIAGFDLVVDGPDLTPRYLNLH